MALRRDENSRSSTSYKPYDVSNSFMKKIANRVTGLIGWRSNSAEPTDIDTDLLSSSTTCISDEETSSPEPKRAKVQKLQEVDAFKLAGSSTNKALTELCSPVQPISDASCVGLGTATCSKSKFFVSSTPASTFSGNYRYDALPDKHLSVVRNSSSQINAIEVNNYLPSEETSINSSSFAAADKHNITLPSLFKVEGTNSATIALNKSTSCVNTEIHKRKPSFNMDTFSSSNRRLSLSICEGSRNKTCLSPFYSARTMYGGASALLPYNSQTASRLRTTSASPSPSTINIFSPTANPITVQPVLSASSAETNNDQETMSAAARRILDTLEKYCSPVIDAKRIPENETCIRSAPNNITISRGIKRKLPTLSQITPNTSDLLRIKRQEKMQESILNARQTASTRSESVVAVDDSDSSSDSTDLDYSVFYQNTRKNIGQDYVGKIRNRRREANKFDDRPVLPLKLPKAVLHLSNLPKIDITETFTFSKPLLLENLETETTVAGNNESVHKSFAEENSGNELRSRSLVRPKITATSCKTTGSLPRRASAADNKKFDKASTYGQLFTTRLLNKNSSVEEITNNRWVCKKCLLENSNVEYCSSCLSQKSQMSPSKTMDSSYSPSTITTCNTTPAYAITTTNISSVADNAVCQQRKQKKNEAKETSILLESRAVAGGKEDSYQLSVDASISKSSSTSNKIRSFTNCIARKTATMVQATASEPTPITSSNDLWKSIKKSPQDSWTCSECWVKNVSADSNCVACGTPNKNAAAEDKAVAAAPLKSNLTFESGKSFTNPIQLGEENKLGFTFGFPSSTAPSSSSIKTSGSTNSVLSAITITSAATSTTASTSAAAVFSDSVISDNSPPCSSSVKMTVASDILPITDGTDGRSKKFSFGIPATITVSSSGSNVEATNISKNNVIPSQFTFGSGAGENSVDAMITKNNSVTTTVPSHFTFGFQQKETAIGNTTSSTAVLSKDGRTYTIANDAAFGKAPQESTTTAAATTSTFTNLKFTSMNSGVNLASEVNNDGSTFKLPPVRSSTFSAPIISSIKENGEETVGDGSGNTLVGDTGSSTTEFLAKKKAPISFTSSLFSKDSAATNSSPNIFGSNGFMKNELKLPNTNNTATMEAGTGNNIFPYDSSNSMQQHISVSGGSDGGGSSSKIIETHLQSSIFANGKNGILQQQGGGEDKNVRLFSSFPNTFVANNGNALPPNQSTSGSIFGSFGSENSNKISGIPAVVAAAATTTTVPPLPLPPTSAVSTTVDFYTAPPSGFCFGMNSITTPAIQTSSGCMFNGPPKLENSSPKFVFGNINATSGSINFGNGGSHSQQLNFASPISSSSVVDRTATNSVFSPIMKLEPVAQQEQQQQQQQQCTLQNSGSSFGNTNLFSSTIQAPAAATDVMKKSGGFSFAAPNQLAAATTVNSFSNFSSSTPNIQDAARLNNATNSMPSSPFMFGNANLTVPSSFNFTGGNSLSTFTAQPSVAANQPARKIKKAVRRTATSKQI